MQAQGFADGRAKDLTAQNTVQTPCTGWWCHQPETIRQRGRSAVHHRGNSQQSSLLTLTLQVVAAKQHLPQG